LAAACKKEGMNFNLYYSVGDSYNPDCICRKYATQFGKKGYELPKGQTPDFDRYVNYMKTHLKELSDIAGDCLMWWFDANWNTNWTPERGRDLYHYMRKLQPNALFSNRIGSPFVINRVEYFLPATEKSFGDYGVTEFHIPAFRRDAPWEYTQTSSDTYSYSKTPIKPAATQIYLMANTVCRDGNFLLASSILPDGSFDERLIKEFDILGKWLDKYGESIYETRGGPYMPSSYYASTCRDNTVYLHIFRMNDGRVVLPALGKKILSVERIGGGKVAFEQSEQNVTIRIDPKDFRAITVDTATGYGSLPPVNHVISLDTIIKLNLDGNAFDIAPIAIGAEEPIKPVEAIGTIEDMLSNP
jgi:alpha-L-fucosidase